MIFIVEYVGSIGSGISFQQNFPPANFGNFPKIGTEEVIGYGGSSTEDDDEDKKKKSTPE